MCSCGHGAILLPNLCELCFAELLERTQWLEDTSRRLADFSENLRDVTHSVQRCEDRLASHDSLGGASRDPKMLERIKVSSEMEYDSGVISVSFSLSRYESLLKKRR